MAGAPPAKRVGFAGDSERMGHSDVPLEISLDFSLVGVGEFGSGAVQFEPFMDDADGADPSKSPYEWDSSAHGTGGSPAYSISLRQVDTHTAFLPHEGSDFVSLAPPTDQDGNKFTACCDNESPPDDDPPPNGSGNNFWKGELELLVGMEHAVHGLNRLEALLVKSS